MPSDPVTARRLAARQRLERAAADTDLEILDALLDAAHDFRSATLAAAPHLHVAGAREALAGFTDLFDDLLGDTLRAAQRCAAAALDDASPLGPPGRAA